MAMLKIAPVEERRGDYSADHLAKLEHLAKEPGAKTFKSAKSAKHNLATPMKEVRPHLKRL